MQIKDTLIKKTRLLNTDVSTYKSGNAAFDTYDYIFIESAEDIIKCSKNQRLASPTDYSLAINERFFYSDKKNDKGEPTCRHWLRSAFSEESCEIIEEYGNKSDDKTFEDKFICPALEFNLENFEQNDQLTISGFPFEIDLNNSNPKNYHTIEFNCLAFPQNRVNELLEKLLEEKYNSNQLKKTNKNYLGEYKNEDYSHNEEFEFEGQRYVRLPNRYNSTTTYYDANLGIIRMIEKPTKWFKVQPIKWIIRNWDDLPKSINPKGKGKTKTIKVRSEKALFYLQFYPFLVENRSLWQNSTIRAYLNGIDLSKTEYINQKYQTKYSESYSDKGFIDEIFIPKTTTEVLKDKKNEAIKQVDDVFYKAIKDAGLEHLL